MLCLLQTLILLTIFAIQNMKLKFYKYQGTGNDFILVDNRNLQLNIQKPALIAKLCDRRFGIGADGLMFLQLKEGYDFEMIYYNADGNIGTMCGNGGRCIVAFARDLGIVKNETYFLAVDGPHYAKISDSDGWISLQMIDVDNVQRDGDDYVLNTGSPHFIRLTKDVANKNMFEEGRQIRYNDTYKAEGINVNFVEDEGSHLFVRTYERGVENETYACGTGVTAAALAMAQHKNTTGRLSKPVKVLGGNLNVRFDYDGKKYRNIFLEGPAKKVFEGEIATDS